MRRLALLAAAVMLAAACGGDEGSAPSSVPPTTGAPGSSVPATTTTAVPATTTTAADTTTTTGAPATTAPPTTTAGTSTTGATTTTTRPVTPEGVTLRLTPVADGFRQPVFVAAPPGDPRLFVVDQQGTISVIHDDGRAVTFLDLRDLVTFGGEQGLLGLAFHPRYPADPRFFVHYSNRSGTNVLAEHRVSAGDPDRADPESARTVLEVPQPARNHNGGMIAFGPDGFLYVALGDGGGGGDPYGNGQDPSTLLGTILRLDVDGGEPYAIPPDNPFAGGGGAAEVWAWGLRNPWRFSFDGDRIFIGDVGQNAWEEIDVVDRRVGGLNFGWPVLEGTHCYAVADCDPAAFEPPVLEYPHDAGRCSVTGGYVYRGAAIPGLAGSYFYGDYCSGAISSFRIDGEGLYDARDWPALTTPSLTSFGVDGDGEMYVVSASGTVFRIDAG
jgi:hypothetical protein